MDLPGEIGLVLRPTAIDQILSVSNTDSGSTQLATGDDLSGGTALNPQTLADTFAVAPGDYNEWRIRGADVSGIFVVSPSGVNAKKRQRLVVDGMDVGEDIWPAHFSLPQIKSAFPDIKLITISTGSLVCLEQ